MSWMFGTCLQARQATRADYCPAGSIGRPVLRSPREGCGESDTLDEAYMEKPIARAEVMQILEDSLTSKGIELWLRAANRLLDGRRPIDLIDRVMRILSEGRRWRSCMAPMSEPSLDCARP